MADDPRGTADGAGREARAETALAAARRVVAREARKARAALTLERLTRALWPAFAVAAAFLGLALLGLFQALPYGLHVAALALFAAAFLAALVRAGLVWRWPTRAEARARLDGGAADRPVAALEDALSAGEGDLGTLGLWRAHQARMAARAARLRAAAPDLRVSAEDRYALRHAALIALALGLMAQIGDGGARLADALRPADAAAAVAPVGPSLEAWASPPVHTGVAPIYLTDRSGEADPIRLPVDTEIVARVFDSREPPTLSGDALATEGFGEPQAGAWTVAGRLIRDGALGVDAEGMPLGDWRLKAIPDARPEIAFVEAPRRARSGATQFSFEASDDYGVTSARALVALDPAYDEFEGFAPRTVFEPIEFDLPLPLTGEAEAVAEEVVEDLVAHPWAGLPVTVTLIAEDGAGQQGLDQAAVTMPGRMFFEPLARALIEQRRLLAWSLDAGPRVRDVLEAVTAYPEDIFEDMTAYLTTRTAIRRLGYALEDDRLAEEAEGIAELLWEAAVRIEDGDLSQAERRLRELQAELEDALERGAPQDEIARLMQELREAMREYLQQLAQESLRDQANGRQQTQPVDPDRMMTSQDLERMLDAIEEALRSGMEEMARQMLQQLQQMLENLQMAQPGQPQPGQGQGDQALNQLQDMIGEQQGLADRSFDALRQQRQGQQGQGQPGQGQPGQGQQPGPGQPGQPGQGRQPGQGGLGGIARDQEGLRQLLEQLRQGLPGEGGGAEALEQAERSMGSARDALEQGDAEGALQDQVEALDSLREGAQDLAQQLAQQQGQGEQAGRSGPSGDVRDEDPFGRPTASTGPMDGESVRVPDEAEMKRARELLDEIRRRAGEALRPEQELEYLRRLLERF